MVFIDVRHFKFYSRKIFMIDYFLLLISSLLEKEFYSEQILSTLIFDTYYRSETIDVNLGTGCPPPDAYIIRPGNGLQTISDIPKNLLRNSANYTKMSLFTFNRIIKRCIPLLQIDR